MIEPSNVFLFSGYSFFPLLHPVCLLFFLSLPNFYHVSSISCLLPPFFSPLHLFSFFATSVKYKVSPPVNKTACPPTSPPCPSYYQSSSLHFSFHPISCLPNDPVNCAPVQCSCSILTLLQSVLLINPLVCPSIHLPACPVSTPVCPPANSLVFPPSQSSSLLPFPILSLLS